MVTGFIWLKIGPTVRTYALENEIPGSIKGGEFFQFRGHNFFKKDPCLHTVKYTMCGYVVLGVPKYFRQWQHR